MHINYVMWGLGRTGGSVTFMEIGKRLVKKGHRVTLTAFDDGYGTMTAKGFKPKWDSDNPIEFIPVSMGNHYRRMLDYAVSRIMNPRVAAFEWEKVNRMIPYIPECDLNVATSFMSTFSVYMSKKGKAQFYHMQHYEPLFFNPQSAPRLSFPLTPRGLGRRLLEKIAPISLSELALLRLAEISYVLPLHRIANSRWLQKTVKEKHGMESTLINHAIRNEIFHPIPQIEKPSQKRILCLGRTNLLWKGVGTLVDALQIVAKERNDIELVLYGSETRPIVDLPHKYVLNPSFEELNKLYCSSSMVICPSWYESFPAPPLEGMACGIPVVTTSIGVEDYALDGENCLVVPPRNPEAMANAILRLLSDEELCKKLMGNGPKTASQFTWDKTTDKLEQLFKDVLNRH